MANDLPLEQKRADIYAAISHLQDGFKDLSNRIDRFRRIKAAWHSEDEPVTIQ